MVVPRQFKSKLVFAAMLTMVGAVNAQWTVTTLHPPASSGSVAYSVVGGQQVGQADAEGGYWSGSAASWVSLHPAGLNQSAVFGAGGDRQAGYVQFAQTLEFHASLWSGTAGSWTDLNPQGSSQSIAFDTDGVTTVGSAYIGGAGGAGLWFGTAASWVSLHPSGAEGSEAYAIDGVHQVGSAGFGGSSHAGMWSGSAASWVDLHPGVAADSMAWGAGGGQQVGEADVEGVQTASLWSGSSASWVNLNPGGSSGSVANNAFGGRQVGWAYVGSQTHASLWSGTAASWTDLHTYLPARFSTSIANGIWVDGTTLYVVGNAYDPQAGRTEAVMWTSPVPEPATLLSVCLGLVGFTGRRRARSRQLTRL